MRPSRGADQHWPCWWRAAGARLCCCGTLHHHNTYVITTTPPQQATTPGKNGATLYIFIGREIFRYLCRYPLQCVARHIAVWYEYGAMAWAGLVMGISRQHTAYILTSEHCTAISHQQTTRAQHNLGTLLQWQNDI